MDSKLKAPRLQAAAWNRLIVGGVSLPGIVQRVRLGGSLQTDRASIAGQSGVVITDANWSEDMAEFQLTVLQSELTRFHEFRSAYKRTAGETPLPVQVGHPLLASFGIQKMLIQGIEIDWDNTKKTLYL